MTTEYSIQKMVSDGTLSTIALGIQYLQRNDIYMRIAGEETPQIGAPSGYTWSFINNTTLKILPVVPNGVEVVVYRRTDVDVMYNIYSQNAQFDEATIDENNQQLLYIAQEYLEQGLPGAGVDTIEFVRDDGTYTYYRLKRTDGSYSEGFTVPSAGSAAKVLSREAIRRSYAEVGYNLVDGSFLVGFTLGSNNDVALDEVTGKTFSGPAGTYPAGTSPISGSFTDRSRVLLRNEVHEVHEELHEELHDAIVSIRTDDAVQGCNFIAHRSSRFGAENSVFNYEKMMDTGGYAGIEIDMCISSDGVLYNFHDRDLSLQTDGVGLFVDSNSSYIDGLRYVAMNGTSFTGSPIERLSDILTIAVKRECWLSAEIKFLRDGDVTPRLSDVGIMVDAVTSRGLRKNTMFTAFDIRFLQAAAEHDADVNLLRYCYPYSVAQVDELLTINSNGFKAVGVAADELTSGIVSFLRSKGLLVCVFACDTEDRQIAAIDSGVTFINTDGRRV